MNSEWLNELDSVCSAYEQGRRLQELDQPDNPRPVCVVMSRVEAIEGVKNWRAAASDHAHTSYWGPHRIRRQRAYWIGVARAKPPRPLDYPSTRIEYQHADQAALAGRS